MEKDEQKIKGNGASLKMWVVANGNTAVPPLSTSPSPIKTAFVNLMTFPEEQCGGEVCSDCSVGESSGGELPYLRGAGAGGNYTDEGVHQTQDPLLRQEE